MPNETSMTFTPGDIAETGVNMTDEGTDSLKWKFAAQRAANLANRPDFQLLVEQYAKASESSERGPKVLKSLLKRFNERRLEKTQVKINEFAKNKILDSSEQQAALRVVLNRLKSGLGQLDKPKT